MQRDFETESTESARDTRRARDKRKDDAKRARDAARRNVRAFKGAFLSGRHA